jgi:hypothetical protein
MSTIAMINKGHLISVRTRHITIKFFFVNEKIENKEIAFEYLPTTAMIADVLTKPLQGELFRRMRMELLNE